MATANLAWVPTVGANIVNQSVQYKKLADSTWTTHATVEPAIDSVAITSLDDNQIYQYRIVTNCSLGGPVNSNIDEKVKITCPSVVVGKTETTVTYSFTHLGKSITAYDVQLRNAAGTSVLATNNHTTPSGTVASQFTSLSAATTYNVQVIPKALGTSTTFLKTDCALAPVTTNSLATEWIENTYVCEQDSVFTLQEQYNGFSSPLAVYYDEPTNRVYVGDHDDTTANAYYFTPDTMTGTASRTYVSGLTSRIYNSKPDPLYRRMYFVGMNNGGLTTLNFATNTYSTIAFGVDAVAFNRLLLVIEGNTIYCNDNTQGLLVLVNRDTLTVRSVIDIDTIPSGNTYFVNYHLTQVEDEIWISSEFRTNSTIAIYNSDLTELLDTITLPGTLTEEFSRYRGSAFYDQQSGKVFVGDAGSSKMFIIDPATRIIDEIKTFTNRQGKAFGFTGMIVDPVTNDLFMNFQGYSSSTDPTKYVRVYKVNRTTFDLEMMHVDQVFSSLSHQVGTANIWGSYAGEPIWTGVTGWDTDGRIYKYSR